MCRNREIFPDGPTSLLILPMFEIFLTLLSALSYPLIHVANGWIFSSLEITPNVGLIYLPAFIRMLNVLVLGKVKGTLATALGGIF